MRTFRKITALLLLCGLFVTTSSIAVAEESTGLLRDNGVLGINKAYECTVDTTRPDAVKARASIAWGWGPIKTGLSYMQLPKGMTTADGRDGVWSYCIDLSTNTVNGHSYSITKLEEGQYYSAQAALKLRAVLMNSYPHKSLEDLERIYGLTDLTREEACAATQWVIWYYSNPGGLLESGGSGEYYPADLYNPSTYSRSTMAVVYYDENDNTTTKQSSNIVTLARGLAGVDPAENYETEPAELTFEKRVYRDKVIFDFSKSKNLDELNNIKVSVKDDEGKDVSYDVSGNKIVVKRTAVFAKRNIEAQDASEELVAEINAKQQLAEDAYFFSPKDGRSASQSRVGVYKGVVPVAAMQSFKISQAEFEKAPLDAQLEVTKEVLLKGEAHRSDDIYYVALFEDKECTAIAENGDVREIRMGGNSIGSVIFDELIDGKTYYIAETDIDGKPLENGDKGIEKIAYDKKSIIAEIGEVSEVKISNCYIEEKYIVFDEYGGGLGDGNGNSSEATQAIDTGDHFTLTIWIVIAAAAIIIMAAVLVAGRKRV